MIHFYIYTIKHYYYHYCSFTCCNDLFLFNFVISSFECQQIENYLTSGVSLYKLRVSRTRCCKTLVVSIFFKKHTQYSIVYSIFKIVSSTRIDGLEYRFIADVTARVRWPLAWVNHSRSSESFNLPPRDLLAGRCDLAMCSQWMTESRAMQFDLTNVVDFQCGTFLVRKPVPLPTSVYVYRAFSPPLWLAVCAALVAVVATRCATVIATETTDGQVPGGVQTLRRLMVGRAMLDGVDALTGHGIARLPGDSAGRMVVLSWTILCLLLGVAYTTRYTALLTSPMYEQPIDTLQDFVDKGELSECTNIAHTEKTRMCEYNNRFTFDIATNWLYFLAFQQHFVCDAYGMM